MQPETVFSLKLLKGLLALGVFLGLFIYLLLRSLRRSPEPLRLVSRWIITAVVLVGMLPLVGEAAVGGHPVMAAISVVMAMICGLVLALVWTPSLVSMVGDWFGRLYTGGNTPPEPQPVYSDAQASRHRGRPQEALQLIAAQLEKFPHDFTGQMMMAEIYAVDLGDLQAAEDVVIRFCGQAGQPPAARAFALNSLADWYLSVQKSREDAQRILEMIQSLLPDSEHSLQAAQRLAHLTSQARLLEPQERRPIAVPRTPQNLGLRPVKPEEWIKTITPAEEAEQLIAQLEQHPLDLEARERLARLYAVELGRLDVALDQMEQLVQCPHVPPKQVAQWLQTMADWQLRLGHNPAAAAATLQRIADLYPGTALASQAQEQIQRLPTTAQVRETPTIALGQYEKYLGLKRKAS